MGEDVPYKLGPKQTLELFEYTQGCLKAKHQRQIYQAAHGPVENDKSMPWEISRRMFDRGEVDSSLDLDKRHSSVSFYHCCKNTIFTDHIYQAHAILRAYQVKLFSTIF